MYKLIRIPIWNRKLLIITPPSDILKITRESKLGRELIRQVKENPPHPNELACVYMCDKTGRYILWIQNKNPRIDTLIHETNHIVRHMMKFIGAGQEKEAHAYTQEYLFNMIKQILR